MGVPIPQPAPASVDSASGAQVIDGSLKFNGVNQYLTKTFSSGNRRTFTLSYWIKEHGKGSSPTNNPHILWSGTAVETRGGMVHRGTAGTDSGRIYMFNQVSNTTDSAVWTNGKFRDFAGWKHVVFRVDSTISSPSTNRVRIYINGVQQETEYKTTPAEDFQFQININQEHRIGRGIPDDYGNFSLSQYYFIDGQALDPSYFGFTDPLTNTWKPRKLKTTGPNDGTTWSSVSTISDGGAASGKPLSNGFDGSTGTAFEGDTSGETVTVPVSATIVKGGVKVYAAVTSGNPLVVLIKNGDTTVETINGNTSGGKFHYSSTYSGPITSLVISRTGRAPEFNAIGINEIILKDDSTTNLDFGTTGFYLPMDNQDDFEKDKSGNGNDWTKNNFSGTESDPNVLKDSPSGAAFGGAPTSGVTTTSSSPSNYCVLNPLTKHADITLSNGNLDVSSSSTWKNVKGTIGVTTGKYYFELFNPSGDFYTGIADYTLANDTGSPSSESIVSINHNGYIAQKSTTYNSYGSSDVVGVTLDADIKKVTFYKNGSVNDANSNYTYTTSNPVFPFVALNSTNADMNFGQKPFKYAPPEGFKSLSSAGAKPAIVISNPTQFVGVATYIGNGGNQSITNYSFKPDLIWVKGRDTAQWNMLTDSVRGNTKSIHSNASDEEETRSNRITSFNSDGFSTGDSGTTNENNKRFVAWCWKAGGNKNTFNIDDVGYASASDAGLDGGTITPSGASVGTKQGFSILTWSSGGSNGNYTISHGLGKKPRFIIQKALDDANWWVYHADVVGETYTKHLQLNSNSGTQTNSANFWGASGHTDSLYGVRVGDLIGSSHNAITYLWADVPGLQKFGSYTCNGDGSGGGDEDGPFVELGFRPAMILFKGSSYTSDWAWIDEKRCKVNYNDVALRANYQYGEIGDERGGVGSSSQPENYAVDFLSNGFKIRASAGSLNYQTNTVTYAAWAKSPFSDLYGGGANAR